MWKEPQQGQTHTHLKYTHITHPKQCMQLTLLSLISSTPQYALFAFTEPIEDGCFPYFSVFLGTHVDYEAPTAVEL